MPTNRSPKGSYVRPTADFYIDQAATVGGFFYPSSAVAAVLDLFNNAQDGSNLHVYKVWVGNDAAGLYGMTRLQGHGATFLSNAFPVVITAATLPGQLYQDEIAAQFSGSFFPKDTPFSDAFIADNEAGSQDTWSAAGPICVIPPGFSMRVYPFVGSGQTGGGQLITATFYYIVLKDRG